MRGARVERSKATMRAAWPTRTHRVAEVGEALYAVVIMSPSWKRHALGAIDRPHGNLVRERLGVTDQGCQFGSQTSSAYRRSRGFQDLDMGGGYTWGIDQGSDKQRQTTTCQTLVKPLPDDPRSPQSGGHECIL